MKDHEIVTLINSSRLEHDRALSYLYQSEKFKTPICNYLNSKGVLKQDVETLWIDIVIKFAVLVKQNKYEHQNKLIGYLKNISHYMALNYFKSNKKNNAFYDLDETIKDPEIENITLHHQELKNLLHKELDLLGIICKEILLMWAGGYSMNEIQDQLQLKSPEATRKRKHTCLKKLLESVHTNESMKNSLMDFII